MSPSRQTAVRPDAIEPCCFLSSQLGLASLCNPVEGNFLDIPFEDATYDGAYAIEATCHAAKVSLHAFRNS